MEMKQMLIDISRRIDDVVDESITLALMKMSEESIMELYKDEPDLYAIADLKVRCNERKDRPDPCAVHRSDCIKAAACVGHL
ncbi:MAG: hypothetical protein MUE87_05755 [Methanothrix sp.]|nr:hypothetical protein [Methanothrix sp.]